MFSPIFTKYNIPPNYQYVKRKRRNKYFKVTVKNNRVKCGKFGFVNLKNEKLIFAVKGCSKKQQKSFLSKKNTNGDVTYCAKCTKAFLRKINCTIPKKSSHAKENKLSILCVNFFVN